MPVRSSKSKAPTWITFIGLMLVLVGLYATVRTGINLAAFEKYPQGGVLSFNIGSMPVPYFQQEKDCNYPQTFYDNSGKIRPASPEEKANVEVQKQQCLDSVKEMRNQAKINDISQSLLFLFLGVGVLVTRKIFFK